MIKKILIFIFIAESAWGSTVTDLGKVGVSCPINTMEARSSSPKFIENLNIDQSMGFSSPIPRKELFETYSIDLPEKTHIQNKRVFVFSAKDPASIESFQKVKADYGLCIDYTGVEDIQKFREKSGAVFPIALGNKQILDYLKIKYYPAVVTINEKNITVESIP